MGGGSEIRGGSEIGRSVGGCCVGVSEFNSERLRMSLGSVENRSVIN